MSAVHGINSLRPVTVYHERREHACAPRRHAVADIFLTEFMRLFNQCIKPRPVCAQSHGRKCESLSRRRFEPASAGSNVDCHDIHAITAEPDGFRSHFTFPGVGPQHGSHAIAVGIDSRPQVVMAIRLNEALRASVGSTEASIGADESWERWDSIAQETKVRHSMSQRAVGFRIGARVPDGSLRYRGIVSRRKRLPYLTLGCRSRGGEEQDLASKTTLEVRGVQRARWRGDERLFECRRSGYRLQSGRLWHLTGHHGARHLDSLKMQVCREHRGATGLVTRRAPYPLVTPASP